MIVYIIIVLTAVVSVICFRNHELADRLALRPYMVVKRRQWERLVTHGFVHGDWTHLLINMLVFWSFGLWVVSVFKLQHQAGGVMDGNLRFILLYFGGLVAASAYDLVKYRNNPNFASIGASGAVSAVVFASIFFNPLAKVYLMGILPLPGIVFGILYLAYESWSARRTGDRINHHAHIFGSVYGFVFPILTGAPLVMFFNSLKF